MNDYLDILESSFDDCYDMIFESVDIYIEGKYVNNISASDAKKAGNYGRDRLSEKEYDKRAKKRIYSTMRGSLFEPMRAAGKKAYGSIEADPEKEKMYRGKRNKITLKDIATHPKDIARGVGNIAKDQSVEQLKRAAITQSSVPGYNPVGAVAPGVGKVLGALDVGISQPLGPGSNRNRAKSLERLSRLEKERLEEIEKNGKVDPLKEKIRNTKGRITVNRALKTLPQTKEIEKDHTVNVGKTILGRSLTNKDFSNVDEVKKVFKKSGELLKNGAKDISKGNFNTPAAEYLKQNLKRDTVNAPKGYTAAVKDYIDTAKNISKASSSALKIGSENIKTDGPKKKFKLREV